MNPITTLIISVYFVGGTSTLIWLMLKRRNK